jgi:hypothetical protein
MLGELLANSLFTQRKTGEQEGDLEEARFIVNLSVNN